MQKKTNTTLLRIDRWSISAMLFFLIFVGSLALSNNLRRTFYENHNQFPNNKTGEIFSYNSGKGTVYITKFEHQVAKGAEIARYGGIIGFLLLLLKTKKL